jgi:hypothetical protein
LRWANFSFETNIASNTYLGGSRLVIFFDEVCHQQSNFDFIIALKLASDG